MCYYASQVIQKEKVKELNLHEVRTHLLLLVDVTFCTISWTLHLYIISNLHQPLMCYKVT